MSTGAVRPAVLARTRRTTTSGGGGAGVRVAPTAVAAASAPIIAALLRVVVYGACAEYRHHFLHLCQECGFAGGERDLSLSDDSVDCVGGDCGLRWRGWHSFKETLGDESWLDEKYRQRLVGRIDPPVPP